MVQNIIFVGFIHNAVIAVFRSMGKIYVLVYIFRGRSETGYISSIVFSYLLIPRRFESIIKLRRQFRRTLYCNLSQEGLGLRGIAIVGKQMRVIRAMRGRDHILRETVIRNYGVLLVLKRFRGCGVETELLHVRLLEA